MTRCLVLIHGDERAWAAATDSEQARIAAGHAAFAAAAGGALLDGGELARSDGVRSLRAASAGAAPGAVAGPLVPSPTTIGGWYLLEVPEVQDAVRLAALLPELAGGHGGIEVRPMLQEG